LRLPTHIFKREKGKKEKAMTKDGGGGKTRFLEKILSASWRMEIFFKTRRAKPWHTVRVGVARASLPLH
jgi:hypothetical protein